MPKLTSGGVRINAMKDGNLKLESGTDYTIGDEATCVQDMIGFAKAEKVKVKVYVPSDGGTQLATAAKIKKFGESLDPVFMIGFGTNQKTGAKFPSPYLAFFEPKGSNDTYPTVTAKKNKYARK